MQPAFGYAFRVGTRHQNANFVLTVAGDPLPAQVVSSRRRHAVAAVDADEGCGGCSLALGAGRVVAVLASGSGGRCGLGRHAPDQTYRPEIVLGGTFPAVSPRSPLRLGAVSSCQNVL